MKNSIFKEINSVHFIGIDGVSMSGLAKFCLLNNLKVTGSDNNLSDAAKRLTSLGATIYKGHSEKNLAKTDAVVYSSAIKEDNPELVLAKKRGSKIYKRSEFLGLITDAFPRSVGVSGSHGKTTATAMMAEIFIKAGFAPTVFLGGESKKFGNFLSGKGDVALYEACEYKRNFLDMHPKFSVILNIDNDHVDTYKTMDEEVDAFKEFAKNSMCFLNADDEYACKVFNSATVTFGIDKLATYNAKNVKVTDSGATFTAYGYGKRLGKIKLKVVGKHFVYDALAAIAVSREMKISVEKIISALGEFDGVKRRNEYLGKINGINCYADYAHHPTEIMANARYKTGRTLAVFQPHTYSRTERLMEDFIGALSMYDGVIIYKTYPARECFSLKGDGKTLFSLLSNKKPNVYYCKDENSLRKTVSSEIKKYDAAVFIGAGDIYDIVKKFCR